MTSVRERRPASLVIVWVGAVIASVVLYFALGAYFLIRGLSGAPSGDGPLPGVALLAVVLAPLAIAARVTWGRRRRGQVERRRGTG